MLNDTQLVTAERLLLGMAAIVDAVQRLNDLGQTLRTHRTPCGIPPIAIRFQPSPLINGENPYGTLVNSMMADEYARRIEAMMEPERLAA